MEKWREEELCGLMCEKRKDSVGVERRAKREGERGHGRAGM